jgi:ATP-dependent protease HslVU (ClpYQ) peptidase subunit
MSTIVAVRKGSVACIAADTLTTFGELRQTAALERHHDKIHVFDGNHLGIVGSAAHHVVMQSLLGVSGSYRFDSRLAVFESFRALHPILKEQYFLNPKDEDDDPYESSRIDALLVNRHGVFGVFALREVFEYERYWAIGAGAEVALGALHALYDRLEDPRAITLAAIEASAEFNSATALPATAYNVDLQAARPATGADGG